MIQLNEAKQKAFKSLEIPTDHRIILCLDGGGIRGILTLQLLKQLEKLAGMELYKFVDFVTGTSTGGIIAGLIASGHSTNEIEELYIQLVNKVFKHRGILANQFLNPPEYTKINYRKNLELIIGNDSLQSVCMKNDIDLMITSKDMVAGEETFFTCVKSESDEYHGTYKDVLLRGVMEATMSAPTYFTPLERFVDGGLTTYNNPTLAAIMEAIHYTPGKRYELDKLTVFSFGTGITVDLYKPDEVVDPPGNDAYFWLNNMIKESGQDASSMQVNLFRSQVFPDFDYRRFQISLDEVAIKKLPNKKISHLHDVEANWLHDLTNEELKGIKLDDVNKFGLMKIIGEAMAEFIMEEGYSFTRDLVKDNKDILITAMGDVVRIKDQMSNPGWINNFEY